MKLKPCPFCGNTKPRLLREVGESWVLCRECRASANMCSNNEAAIRSWNKRDDIDLRKLVEKWRKEKDFLGSDREALPYGDCADELEAELNRDRG